jgi:hypothetical protein
MLISRQWINRLLIQGLCSARCKPESSGKQRHPPLWHKACNIPFEQDEKFGLPIPS